MHQLQHQVLVKKIMMGWLGSYIKILTFRTKIKMSKQLLIVLVIWADCIAIKKKNNKWLRALDRILIGITCCTRSWIKNNDELDKFKQLLIFKNKINMSKQLLDVLVLWMDSTEFKKNTYKKWLRTLDKILMV